MTKARGVDRLSGEAKTALFASLQNQTATPQQRPPAKVVRDTAFNTLPGFEEFRVARATADVFQIANPFYRVHDVRAGATSVIEGREVVNFGSYDYLGLNGHPKVNEAVRLAAERWGTSVSASRITAGERTFHVELEHALAALYQADDAIAFVSGHATNISAISQLVGTKDLVLHDELMHNSAVVGARLSGAQRRIFPHNNFDALERLLATERDRYGRVLILVEGLYSMDGDMPDLARLVDIKTQYGAWLMVDDAHALGTLGARGHGVAEELGVDPRSVDIWMGTMSKTLVSCGGYVAGSHDLVDYLKYTAPGFVYSVGMPATAAAAAIAAIELMTAEPERVARLQSNGRLFLENARAVGLDTGSSDGFCVTPVIIGDSLKTVFLAQRLIAHGVNAVPIIPPGVPEKSARLRFFISAAHTPEQLRFAVKVVREEMDALEREGVSLANVAKIAATFNPSA